MQGEEVTGSLRGATLLEKKYGPGFRETKHQEANAPWAGCGIEGCTDPIHGSIELYVDDIPPIIDWYSKLLNRLPQNVWTKVRFCQGHLADVTKRSTDDVWDGPDQWAPWRESPFVLTHPPKTLAKPKLILPGG